MPSPSDCSSWSSWSCVVLVLLLAAWMGREAGGYLLLVPALWSASGVAQAALERLRSN
jgi:hypothetical protein